MSTENEEKAVGATMELSTYMLAVIEKLKHEQKYAECLCRWMKCSVPNG